MPRFLSGWTRGMQAMLLCVAWLAPAVVEACEACKEAVKGDPVGTALSATTLLLIAMPMLLIGSVGGWIGYMYWRAARGGAVANDAAEETSEIVSQPV